jgi:hypothetical protein
VSAELRLARLASRDGLDGVEVVEKDSQRVARRRMLGVERLAPGQDPKALGKHDEFCSVTDDRDATPCDNCVLEHLVLGVRERGHGA